MCIIYINVKLFDLLSTYTFCLKFLSIRLYPDFLTNSSKSDFVSRKVLLPNLPKDSINYSLILKLSFTTEVTNFDRLNLQSFKILLTLNSSQETWLYSYQALENGRQKKLGLNFLYSSVYGRRVFGCFCFINLVWLIKLLNNIEWKIYFLLFCQLPSISNVTNRKKLLNLQFKTIKLW